MALPVHMQTTEQRIRDENTTTLDDISLRLVRDFSTVVPRTHDHVSNTISNLNAHVANTRFGMDYTIIDDEHVEESMRAMIESIYQVGTEQLFDTTRTRRERIAAFAIANGKGLAQKISTNRILNLNRTDMLATIKDHIREYHTTATHDEREQIAHHLSVLSDRAHKHHNLRPELAALSNTPYSIFLKHAI